MPLYVYFFPRSGTKTVPFLERESCIGTVLHLCTPVACTKPLFSTFKFKCLLYSDDEVVSNLHNHIAANKKTPFSIICTWRHLSLLLFTCKLKLSSTIFWLCYHFHYLVTGWAKIHVWLSATGRNLLQTCKPLTWLVCRTNFVHF